MQTFEKNEDDIGVQYIVEQYTGLKDINDKDIYEGDIVKWGMSTLSKEFFDYRIIEWNEPQLLWKAFDPNKRYVDYLYEARQPSTRWCEVVGNLMETPELIVKP